MNENPTEESQSLAPQTAEPASGKSLTPWLVVALLLLIVVGMGVALLVDDDDDDEEKSAVPAAPASRTSDWHAIFLNNGQVYFGHLSNTDSSNFTLEDIYYLQAQQPLQPPSEESQPQQDLALVKLGRFELHCPVDEMTINRDQVIFWEKLKTDSQVVQAIEEYLKTDDVGKPCYEGGSQAPPSSAPVDTTTTTAASRR